MRTMKKIYMCPSCRERFTVPEPNPSTNFKGNFSCHVLFKHMRSEVESQIGSEDLEICPVDDCDYNIVQLKEDGVPEAETFLIKHYIGNHLDILLPLIQDHPLYDPTSCLKTISVIKPNNKSPDKPPKTTGMPNSKLKPIFVEKYNKFSRAVARCENAAECDPNHVVAFLSQWTSRRNYSIAGIRTLVHWISEVHNPVAGKPLYFHPKVGIYIFKIL